MNIKKTLKITNKKVSKCYINFTGKVESSGGYLTFNDIYHVPINSEISMPLAVPTNIKVSLTIAAKSKIEIENIIVDLDANTNLVDTLDKKSNVLVIVPDYPSYINLYSCAFAHSRNKEYLKNGLNIQVFSTNSWYQIKYKRNDIPVLKGSYKDSFCR